MSELTKAMIVMGFISKNRGKSAYQIAQSLGYYSADVSALLKKLIDKKAITRRANKGPRGGFGYYPKITRTKKARINE